MFVMGSFAVYDIWKKYVIKNVTYGRCSIIPSEKICRDKNFINVLLRKETECLSFLSLVPFA